MKFALLTVSGSNPAWLKQAASDYLQKINPLIAFSIHELKAAGRSRDDKLAKVKAETEEILDWLTPEDFVVLFDEKGKVLDSNQFSKQLNQALISGKKRTVFIVGGAFGVDESIRKRANQVLSLSGFVLNHHVAQVVVLEQIYRGLAILKNLPYHNA